MKRLVLLVALLPFAACGAAGCPPQPTPPTPDADAAPAPVVEAGPAPSPDAVAPTDACGRGEATLLRLACSDSRGRLLGGPNLHGVAWSTICRNNAINGIDMHPDCIASKTSCTEITTSCR